MYKRALSLLVLGSFLFMASFLCVKSIDRIQLCSEPVQMLKLELEQLEEKGYQTDTELLSAEQTAAADHIAKALQLPLESQVFVIKRLRCVNGAPLSLHTSYIPSDLCPELLSDDLETTALCHILEQRYDISPLRGEESLESLNASAPQAKLLGVKPGAGLLYLECTMYSTQNRPYLLDKVFFRGDSIKLQFSYQRELQLSSLK